LDAFAKKMGSTLFAPFMSLSFMALLVIPSIKLSDFILLDMAQFEGNPLTERIIAKFLHRTTKKLLLYGSHLSDHQRIIKTLLEGVYKKNYAMTINDSHHFGFSVIENLNPREANQVLP
jgi:hypothetical protein